MDLLTSVPWSVDLKRFYLGAPESSYSCHLFPSFRTSAFVSVSCCAQFPSAMLYYIYQYQWPYHIPKVSLVKIVLIISRCMHIKSKPLWLQIWVPFNKDSGEVFNCSMLADTMEVWFFNATVYLSLSLRRLRAEGTWPSPAWFALIRSSPTWPFITFSGRAFLSLLTSVVVGCSNYYYCGA